MAWPEIFSETKFRKAVGKRIEEARKARCMTQEELAKKVGVPRTNLRNWESGVRGIKAENLYLIALELNVPSDYLLTLTNSMTKEASARSLSDETGLTDQAIDALQGMRFDDGWRVGPEDEEFDYEDRSTEPLSRGTDSILVVSRLLSSERFPKLIQAVANTIIKAGELRKHVGRYGPEEVLENLPEEIRSTKFNRYEARDYFERVLDDILVGEGHKATIQKVIDTAEDRVRECHDALPDGEREKYDFEKGW